jgi:hypothetical protein
MPRPFHSRIQNTQKIGISTADLQHASRNYQLQQQKQKQAATYDTYVQSSQITRNFSSSRNADQTAALTGKTNRTVSSIYALLPNQI